MKRTPASLPPDGSLPPRDRVTEAHLQAMGLYWQLGGVFTEIAAVVILVLAVLYSTSTPHGRGEFILMAIGVVGMVLALVGEVSRRLGKALSERSNVARLVSGIGTVVLCAIVLMRVISDIPFPLAVSDRAPDVAAFVIGSYFLTWWLYSAWVLLSPRAAAVTRPDYDLAMSRDEDIASPVVLNSFFFWAPILALVLIMVVAIAGQHAR